jgi:hypothetical protein
MGGEVPAVEEALRALGDSFRRLWLERNKPFGLEVLQIRLGGQLARYAELGRRLEEFLAGQVDAIPELDAHLPQAPAGELGRHSYRWLATPSSIL